MLILFIEHSPVKLLHEFVPKEMLFNNLQDSMRMKELSIDSFIEWDNVEKEEEPIVTLSKLPQ